MGAARHVAVLQGTVKEFSLADILQVLSIGRQYTGIELTASDGSLLGRLFVKSGQLVSATAGKENGKAALVKLIHTPSAFFRVYRTETPNVLPRPLGPVGELLLEAAMEPEVEVDDSGWEDKGTTLSSSTAIRSETPSSAAGPPTSRPSASASAAAAAKDVPGAPAPKATPAAVSNGLPASATPKSAHPAAPPKSPPPPAAAARAPIPAPPKSPAPPKAPAPAQARTPTQAPATTAPKRNGNTSRSGVHRATDVPVRRGGEGGDAVVLAVASPKGGCGKTTLALNLALTLARRDWDVVLVDADVNGDVLSAIDARARPEAGAFDVLSGRAKLADSLLATVLPTFRILPSTGGATGEQALGMADSPDLPWAALLSELSARHRVVIIDTPAGMNGTTAQVLAQSTHVLGVLQAEVLAQRSFERFGQALSRMPETRRPEVAGVVLNMVQPQAGPSVSVLQRACSDLPASWLLETSIPRSADFLDAAELGLPLRLLDDKSPPAVTWLFETLASELVERLALPTPQRAPAKLLL